MTHSRHDALDAMPTHYVKVRKVGAKAWKFLTPRASVNRLRIYAAQFTEASAARLIADNAADNPDWEFKAVTIASTVRGAA